MPVVHGGRGHPWTRAHELLYIIIDIEVLWSEYLSYIKLIVIILVVYLDALYLLYCL